MGSIFKETTKKEQSLMRVQILTGVFLIGSMVGLLSQDAWAKSKYRNLEVLQDNGKALQKGMKILSKGLGVKCKACHVKGEFESDRVEAKKATRIFLKNVVGESSGKKKKAALSKLLAEMKLDAAKNPAKVWASLEKFKLKAGAKKGKHRH